LIANNPQLPLPSTCLHLVVTLKLPLLLVPLLGHVTFFTATYANPVPNMDSFSLTCLPLPCLSGFAVACLQDSVFTLHSSSLFLSSLFSFLLFFLPQSFSPSSVLHFVIYKLSTPRRSSSQSMIQNSPTPHFRCLSGSAIQLTIS
jgi:hypothetical protein